METYIGIRVNGALSYHKKQLLQLRPYLARDGFIAGDVSWLVLR